MWVIQTDEGMIQMSIAIMGLEAELAYRRDRFLAEADAARQARAIRNAGSSDRAVQRARKSRRSLAARGSARQHAWR